MPPPTRVVNYDFTSFTGEEAVLGSLTLRLTPSVSTTVEGHIVPSFTQVFNPDAAGQGAVDLAPGNLGSPAFDYIAEVFRLSPDSVSQYEVRSLGRFRVP